MPKDYTSIVLQRGNSVKNEDRQNALNTIASALSESRQVGTSRMGRLGCNPFLMTRGIPMPEGIAKSIITMSII